MAFFPGRSRVERNRSTGKITSSDPKKEFRHAIDKPIWHVVRPDSHRGWPLGHACGTGAATISLWTIGNNAQPDDAPDKYPHQKHPPPRPPPQKDAVTQNN